MTSALSAQTENAAAQTKTTVDPIGIRQEVQEKEIVTQEEKTSSQDTDQKKQTDRRASSSKKIEEVTFEDIEFEMDEDETFERDLLTERIGELDGKEIRIRGFMRPDIKSTGIDRFIFVRDNQECCFGPGAALCDCVLVKLKNGQTVDYTVRPITITGKFYLKEFRVGKKKQIMAIYRMKNVVVE